MNSSRATILFSFIQLVAAALSPTLVRGTGLAWPTNQLLPAFTAPVSNLDLVDVSSSTGDEVNLFASLAGIVNRTQPQIVLGGGGNTWQNLHNLTYTVLTNNYATILKYRSYVTGLVVTDTNQPDTLNLATTIAGVKNELICGPSLVATLTNAPYSLTIMDDLRGRFTDKYGVYNYLYANYWSQCTHRIIAGMETGNYGSLRDYLVAVKAATVWLDPSVSQDATTLAQFVSNMTPNNGVYVGWWPNEGAGLDWIANYGIPTLASDFYSLGSIFSGCRPTINIPGIPPPPPLQNKIYVALIVSDGDNLQYMQGLMKSYWGSSARGQVPISWTVTPLAADIDPGMLNYYWNTASANECLISGPDGAGYAHIEKWSSANKTGFAQLSNGYLQRSGLSVITVWNSVNSSTAQAYATNCPSLLGLTDQNGTYNAVDLGLRTIALNPTYPSLISQLTSGISNAAAGWNGTAPLFIAAQADTWGLSPDNLLTVMNSFDPNKYQFVRADHLFMLANGLLAPATINIATANQAGAANTYPFTPTWSVVTNGDLLLGQAPGSSAGNFSEEVSGRNVNSLTSGGSLMINSIAGTSGTTCSTNYVTCGNSSGAGSTIVYTLNGSANGFNLTNITVYGGWQDNGRDQQAYTVYYSTVAAPTNFIALTTVNYNPTVAASTPSSTKVTVTPVTANGVLAANVAALKFDFTNPSSENGYCGYAQIAAYGSPSPVIITTNQTGVANTYPFTPSWSVVTNGDVLLGQIPSTALGDFSLNTYGRNVNSLTAGGTLTISQISGGADASLNYVPCGNAGGAGCNITYALPGSANGYNLTNITVYGGWQDNGRDQQAYTVYYSTVAAPTNFIPLTSVNFNPAVPASTADATRVMIVPATGSSLLAANVAAVKLDFSGQISENGYCGYAQIAAYGTANSTILAAPTGLSATAGNAQVSLNWTASTGATSYNVKRATVSGGPFTTVTNVTGTFFANPGLANGTKYYFVVSAVNGGCESANSSQVSAKPQAPVNNFSFEFDATSPGGAETTVPISWTAFNEAAGSDIGSENAGGTDYTVNNPLAAPAAGNQYCYVNMFNPSVTGGIYQDVGTLRPNTTYALTVAIGSRADRINSPGIISLVNGTNNTGTVLATGGGLPASQNTWQNYTVTYTTGASVSGDLTIVLSVLGNGTTIQADFDNVQITSAGPSVTVPNFGFETPSIGSGNYQYNPSGGSWTFGGSPGSGSGIVANGSAFNDPTAPQGTQAAFVQEYGTISQSLSGFSPGTNYTVTFSAAQRPGPYQNGGQSWNVAIDGTAVASFNPGPSSTNYATYTASFTATATTHTLSFVGTDLATGDNTVFLDNIQVAVTSPLFKPTVSIVPNAPTFGVPQVLGSDLILTGAGGTPGAPYTWLTTTNLSDPINWTTNSTGTLDGTGAFSNALPINASRPTRFFKLRMP